MDRLGRFDKWGYKNSFSKGELARELVYMNEDYDNLKQQLKKKDEVINRLKKLNLIINDSDYVYSQDEITSKNLELLSILEDKEVE